MPADPHCRNEVLASLWTRELQQLRPALQLVELDRHAVIYELGDPAKQIYFPHDAVVSLVAVMRDGCIAETGTVGREGFTGCDTLLGSDSTSTSRLIVQVPGWASRTPRAALRELMETSPHAAELLGAYTKAFIAQLLQSVACNASHSVEERCARWLLMTHDRAESDSFELTQELLAVMLGVRRASVGRVSSTFQQSGLIRYRRGVITIANRPGLESVSCECYSIVRRAYEQLLPRPGTKQRAYAR